MTRPERYTFVKTAVTLAAIAIPLAGCTVAPPRTVAEVAVREIDADGLEQALESHRGQVVLVDFWATWCGPCLDLFPHTVELHQRFGALGLAVITVSLDNTDNRPAVQQFLDDSNATMENFLSVYGVGPFAFTAFGIDDGALPHMHLYDRQGKLHRTFSSGGGPIDPRQIEQAVETLIKDES